MTAAADAAGLGLTYAAAGVDTAAGDRAVELLAERVRRTHRSGPAPVLDGAGGFAGMVDVSFLTRLRRPVLATSTDGVGTKLAIAQAMDVHDTVGIDLVAMVVDDLVACGAQPLFLTDYLVVDRVRPERVAEIVGGVARGCEAARCPLIAGETAEHPGLLGPGGYDLAGAATGVLDADDVLGPGRVEVGDVALAIAASGLHSNGFSLARAIVAVTGWQWASPVAEFGRSLGEELLAPTAIYTAAMLDVLARLPGAVHALVHVTGGGIAANVARVMPVGLHLDVDRATWVPGPVYTVLGEAGGVSPGERERTWNQGIGMIALVDAGSVAAVRDVVVGSGFTTWPCGQVAAAEEVPAGATSGTKGVKGGSARLVGAHPG